VGKPPEKREGALLHAPIRKLLGTTYRSFAQAQVRRVVIRRCASCDARVSNRSLGGFNGRSALSGVLFCQRCADWPGQLFLNFGRWRS
jgi:hypothetical protein